MPDTYSHICDARDLHNWDSRRSDILVDNGEGTFSLLHMDDDILEALSRTYLSENKFHISSKFSHC